MNSPLKHLQMESRIPEAMFAVGEQDATRLNVQDGQRITVKAGRTSINTCTSHRILQLAILVTQLA